MTMSEIRTPPAEHMITLQIPAGHLQVIFAGLGELPQKISGPTHAYLSNQLTMLAAADKERQDAETKAHAQPRVKKAK